MLDIAKPKRLYQKIGRDIRQQIIDGEYEVGNRLPSERDIAENLNISRTIVREALIMLELEELIEVRKGSGIHVISNKPGKAFCDQKTENDVGPFELLQARQLLESNIAGFAATQVNRHNLKKMYEALEVQKEELQAGNGSQGDEMFHAAVAEATQNTVLISTTQQLWETRLHSPLWKRIHEWIDSVDYLENWLGDHQKIIDAIIRKNPQEAHQAMWQHLENVKSTLLRVSDRNDECFDRYIFDDSPSV